jgi:hypothetical protein
VLKTAQLLLYTFKYCGTSCTNVFLNASKTLEGCGTSVKLREPSVFWSKPAFCIAKRISEASNKRKNANGVGDGVSVGDG